MSNSHVLGVIDLTFMDIADEVTFQNAIIEKTTVKTIQEEEPISPENIVVARATSPGKNRKKETIKGIKLSYNLLVNTSFLINPLATINPSNLLWIDLSFNKIESISIEFLLLCPNLTTIQLQANKLSKLSVAKSFSVLTCLKSLALYGNPCSAHKYYRKYVLYYNPHLIQFDSTMITKDDRVKVSQFHSIILF